MLFILGIQWVLLQHDTEKNEHFSRFRRLFHYFCYYFNQEDLKWCLIFIRLSGQHLTVTVKSFCVRNEDNFFSFSVPS